MKNIVIASGKGGTGKTTVAVNLAHYISTIEKQKVTLLDCDVEAPNDNLFINAKFSEVKEVKIPRPIWIEDKCNSCGKCVSVCNYSAIAKVKNKILVFNELCHSCGACIWLCPQSAFKKEELAIGRIEFSKENTPFAFGHGILNIGESLAPMVIKHLKTYMGKDSINIIDASPGTTCPVVKSMEGMDYCLLVTEPTPFGLNDLSLALALAAQLNLPTGIVINRSYGEDKIIEDFAKSCQIPIVGKIPFDKKYAKSYSQGEVLIEKFFELKEIFKNIYWQMKLNKRVPLVRQIKDQDIDKMINISSENKNVLPTSYREIVVISGKGGTGKTTITSALAELMENKMLADNDVDASNLYLICRPEVLKSGDFTGGKKYFIESDKCVGCSACINLCRFDAINPSSTVLGKYEINELSCEGCGFCYQLCKFGAIKSKNTVSGKWYISKTSQGYLSHAKLGTGEENSGKLVSLVRSHASEIAQHFGLQQILSDGPPGTGCPVISSITGVDLALVVTEPTLSGIHDMLRAFDLAKHFGVPTMIIINKFDLNMEMTDRIVSLSKEYRTKVIGKIPFDKNVHDALLKGESVIKNKTAPACKAIMNIWENLKGEIQ